MFNVLLVDDDQMFTQGLIFLLDALKPGIAFKEAVNLDQSQRFENTQFDLVLLDYYFRNSEIEGLNAIRMIRKLFPNSTVVVLSGADYVADFNHSISINDLKVAGASGFISKSSTQDVLIMALRLILGGEEFFPASMFSSSKLTDSEQDRVLANRLTPRQVEIVSLAAKGTPNKIIAKQLYLSEGAVKAHLTSIYRVLGVKNRTQAARILYQLEGASNLKKQF